MSPLPPHSCLVPADGGSSGQTRAMRMVEQLLRPKFVMAVPFIAAVSAHAAACPCCPRPPTPSLASDTTLSYLHNPAFTPAASFSCTAGQLVADLHVQRRAVRARHRHRASVVQSAHHALGDARAMGPAVPRERPHHEKRGEAARVPIPAAWAGGAAGAGPAAEWLFCAAAARKIGPNPLFSTIKPFKLRTRHRRAQSTGPGPRARRADSLVRAHIAAAHPVCRPVMVGVTTCGGESRVSLVANAGLQDTSREDTVLLPKTRSARSMNLIMDAK